MEFEPLVTKEPMHGAAHTNIRIEASFLCKKAHEIAGLKNVRDGLLFLRPRDHHAHPWRLPRTPPRLLTSFSISNKFILVTS